MATTHLITGGAGFIGSHLTESLLARGDRVLALDDLSTGCLDNIRGALSHPAYQFAEGSVSDPGTVGELAAQAQTVFHLAAAVGVQLIVEHPVHTIVTNVMGTEVVLDAARQHGCRVGEHPLGGVEALRAAVVAGEGQRHAIERRGAVRVAALAGPDRARLVGETMGVDSPHDLETADDVES